MGGMKATLIYLDCCMLLSKKAYQDWREIQKEYWDCYHTSLPPMTMEEIMRFFHDDFGEEACWPFSRSEIITFFKSDSEIMKSSERILD